jgi:transposase
VIFIRVPPRISLIICLLQQTISKEEPMNYVNVHRDYYAGIDMHATRMTLCIVSSTGAVILRRTLPNYFNQFLKIIQPYQHSIAVALESTFNWYWFVDACRATGIEVYLGHAYYMKAIHADKKKNDKIDAEKIANLLRAGLLPRAYACPLENRVVRDLVRHRHRLVYMRSRLLGQAKQTFYQYGHIDTKRNGLKAKKTRQATVDTLTEPCTHTITNTSMELTSLLDKEIALVEQQALNNVEQTRKEDLDLLMTIPGVGRIIALTILNETDTLARFRKRQDYASYCRLAKPQHTSNGKCVGISNAKCGNPTLKWAYMEIITNATAHVPQIRVIHEQLLAKFHPLKARAILANNFCSAVYYMLKNKKPFDVNKFCNLNPGECSQEQEAGDLLQNEVV